MGSALGTRPNAEPRVPSAECRAHYLCRMDSNQPAPSFRWNLLRVMGVQVLTLLVLWLLQSRYGR